MPKAETLDLAHILAMNLDDPPQVSRYYRDVIFDYGPYAFLTAATLVEAVHVTSQYTLPDEVIDVLGIIYDDAMLSMEAIMSLDWIDPEWRNALGSPVAFVREQESTPNFRIYPRPEQPSKPFDFATGSPLGTDYPEYSILVLHSEIRDDVLPYMELPTALRVLVPEFSRESAHKDTVFAGACSTLSNLLLKMIS